MAKRFRHVKTTEQESNRISQDGQVVSEGKALGARNEPEFTEENLEAKNEKEGRERAPLLHPPFDPDFVLGEGREDRDNPDVGEQRLQHVENPAGEGHGHQRRPYEVMTHGVKGPLGIQEKAVSLLFLGHGLVEVVSR